MSQDGRTGVLTFHRCINYGSYWQARCLVEGLRARGHEVELLDYQSQRVNRAEWRCALHPARPAPLKPEDIPHYRIKLERFLCAVQELPLSAPFDLDDATSVPSYDNVVVGSDEVWNLSHPWFGGCPLFYGDGLKGRMISYAASCGNYDACTPLPDFWAGKLHAFSSISVRDENSRLVIRQALGLEPWMVLDPCLQFPPENPASNSSLPAGSYVAVYGHNFTPGFRREVAAWAKGRGMPLLSIGYRNDWADIQWLEAGPLEFAAAIAGAGAVATNFFHGCVFSLLNRLPFVSEKSDYRSLKVQGLLTLLNARDRLAEPTTTAEEYDRLLSGPPGHRVFATLVSMRAASSLYLDRALG